MLQGFTYLHTLEPPLKKALVTQAMLAQGLMLSRAAFSVYLDPERVNKQYQQYFGNNNIYLNLDQLTTAGIIT